jgi:hypothetical protein
MLASTPPIARFNQYGSPASFNIGDKVKIYVPPTAKQMDKTGRKAKHIIAWRGPCTVTQVLPTTTYEMTEDSSHRTFQRSLVNIRPYRVAQPAPPPHHDLLSLVHLTPGSIVAIKESDHLKYVFRTILSDSSTTLEPSSQTSPAHASFLFGPIQMAPLPSAPAAPLANTRLTPETFCRRLA